jgi:predicted nucleic acid-binding protein
MGPRGPPQQPPSIVTRYLLDTTVLIAHLRGDEDTATSLLSLHEQGHSLCTTCVNVAEIERGLRPKERKTASALMDRLEYLITTREAAFRAGRYQAEWKKRGKTVELADALIAATARVHGAILLTDNVTDFPMRDVRVQPPMAP